MVKDIQNGQIINVQGYKHDGTLYRQWNGVKVIEVSPHTLVLFLYKTKVKERGNQRWVVREPMIWWFPVDGFFNTTGLIRASGTHFYTNLASPPIFEDNTLKFIDYDLDVKAYPEVPVKVVDKREYEEHKVKYNYPESLIKKIDETVGDVLKMIKHNESYFDEDVVGTYLQSLIDNGMLAKKFERT